MKLRENTILIILVFALIGFGMVMIYSTSAIYASKRYNDYLFFFKKSVIFSFISLIGLAVGFFINYRFLGRLSLTLFILSFIALFLVFTPFGVEAGGARRWVNFHFFAFQPSEIMKFISVLFLSYFMASRLEHRKSFSGFFLPILFIIGMSTLPILIEPDFGTTALVGTVGILLIIAAGSRLRYVFSLFIAVLPFVYFMIVQTPYRLKRVMVFLNPWKEARSTGYQIIQSFIAFQSGGWNGLGLGGSRQKLFYLPEAHTDFIFSIIGEELGFIGTLSVLIVFAMFIFFGLKIAVRCENPFGKLLAFGLVSMIGLQAFLNMGVVTGILPTKGLPLPFISYGGTNLVMTMIAIGVLLNISRLSVQKQKKITVIQERNIRRKRKVESRNIIKQQYYEKR
ncbi:MAG: putative lipid II flippase FtsW [Candidatus Aureabacteria bacterium]|nr:putative lipid II flippase FtsW [Candidatus Auribacterota bacterium]